MIKKAIVGGAVALLLATFFVGRDLASYVRTSAGQVQSTVTDAVPTEFQIERARGMIKDLVPEIRKNMHVIAKEEVEVENLEKQIAQTETRLNREKSDVMRLKADLETGEANFAYAGRTYTADRVKVDLANRFERYQTGEATLNSLHEIHTARLLSLDAARVKLENTLAEKRQLEVDVENIEAQMEMVAAAQTTCDYSFDDSKLGRVKELVADLHAKLDVAARLVDAEGSFHDQIPLDKEAPEDIVAEVAEYFSQPNQPASEELAVDLTDR